MLPPVLEIYVVWHPADMEGAEIAGQIVDHYRGTAFTGLIAGAVEVFVRSEGWENAEDAPRSIPSPDAQLPNGIQQAQFTAIIPIIGTAIASRSPAWCGGKFCA